jgi:hypothetical protein
VAHPPWLPQPACAAPPRAFEASGAPGPVLAPKPMASPLIELPLASVTSPSAVMFTLPLKIMMLLPESHKLPDSCSNEACASVKEEEAPRVKF